MSKARRVFSAEFKTNLVLQLLQGEKELNILAAENNIQPYLLRNWKKEFLSKASVVFDNQRDDNLRKKIDEINEKCDLLQKNFDTIEELFRLQLVNSLIDDAESAMKLYKETQKRKRKKKK